MVCVHPETGDIDSHQLLMVLGLMEFWDKSPQGKGHLDLGILSICESHYLSPYPRGWGIYWAKTGGVSSLWREALETTPLVASSS